MWSRSRGAQTHIVGCPKDGASSRYTAEYSKRRRGVRTACSVTRAVVPLPLRPCPTSSTVESADVGREGRRLRRQIVE